MDSALQFTECDQIGGPPDAAAEHALVQRLSQNGFAGLLQCGQREACGHQVQGQGVARKLVALHFERPRKLELVVKRRVRNDVDFAANKERPVQDSMITTAPACK